jgi:uncharacterized protein (TIGR04168 family)
VSELACFLLWKSSFSETFLEKPGFYFCFCCYFFRRFHPLVIMTPSSTPQSRPTLRIAAIGDIHDCWTATDNALIEQLDVDLVLFVGDFGNESLPTIRQVARIPRPAAAIYGNHDAWYTASPWGRGKRPYDIHTDNWFEQQLEILNDLEIGYRYRDFSHLNLSAIGGRPFSWGGSEWKYKKFYRDRYGVKNFADSIAKQVEAIEQAAHDTLIFLGHTGPTGMGDQPEDPCGKDWNPIGGDYGDPDFAAAIDQAITLGKHVPLVVFGHMHHNLRHRSDRLRRAIHHNDHGTLFFNAARVPRIMKQDTQILHQFPLIEITNGSVTSINLVWLSADGSVATSEELYSSL